MRWSRAASAFGALIGLLPHSFFDGVAIAGRFMAAKQLGVRSSSPSRCKVPTGITLASVMLASGAPCGKRSRRWCHRNGDGARAAITPAIGLLGSTASPSRRR